MEGKDLLTEKIINCCFKVHNELGPGFKERIYHNALKLFLDEEGLKYETEKAFEVTVKGERVGSFKLDLIMKIRL